MYQLLITMESNDDAIDIFQCIKKYWYKIIRHIYTNVLVLEKLWTGCICPRMGNSGRLL